MAEVGNGEIIQLIDLPHWHGGNFLLIILLPLVLIIYPLHSNIYGRAVFLRSLILTQLKLAAIHTSYKGGTRSQYTISLNSIVFVDALFEMFLHGLVIQCAPTDTKLSVVSQGCVCSPLLIKAKNSSHMTTLNDTRCIFIGFSLTLMVERIVIRQ